jgi:hypothetical protein
MSQGREEMSTNDFEMFNVAVRVRPLT